MLWRRKGQILVPPTSSTGVWRTHCQAPILLPLTEKRWRLIFAGRDERNRSHGFIAELDLGSGVKLIDLRTVPVLSPGKKGTFDAEGAMPASVVVRGPELWLYYTGWSVRRDVPFQTAIGLAVSQDGGLSFERVTSGPVLAQGIDDEFSVLAPLVVDVDGALRMFYPSVVSWQEWKERLEPRYALKSACSHDGLHWVTSKEFVLDFSNAQEGGISRPSVIRHGGMFHMWYSHRGWKDYRTHATTSYKFGYAVSQDADKWRRCDDQVAFVNPPEPDEWDGLMQAYPTVIRFEDELLCFYCGNGFGQAGIGYATLEGGVKALSAKTATM